MNEKKQLLSDFEKAALGATALLVALNVLFWRQLSRHPLVSFGGLGLLLLAGLGWWVWRNYKLVTVHSEQVASIQAKLEGVIYSLFSPRGWDILAPLKVDDQAVGWALLSDNFGIPVSLLYVEREMGKMVLTGDVQRLIERMNVDGTPKGICITTGTVEPGAVDFAKQNNILTRDGDQLLDMLRQAEEQKAGQPEHLCHYCGTRLVESLEVTALWRCPNPDCRKEFTEDELEDAESGDSAARRKTPRDLKIFNIDCYACGRPVELDTTMRGLMECPYEDCSWIINVDNEILALSGGLDKRVSERLTEIKCPHCERRIKVPADAEGLMECPCEEKWIIDVGAALGLRAQAQIAEGSATAEPAGTEPAAHSVEPLEYGPPAVAVAEAPYPEDESGSLVLRALARARRLRSRAEAAKTAPSMVAEPAVPGPVAGISASLPVAGAALRATVAIPASPAPVAAAPPAEAVPAQNEVSASVAAPAPEKHPGPGPGLSTRGLVLFLVAATAAFFAFVYFVAR